nr:hypothetical protein [Tanacetum cinerariifolium]
MVSTEVLTQSKPVSNTAVRPVSAALPNITTSNSPPRVTAVKALVVSAVQGKQGTWELNGGYVAFGGNPKGGKITGKGKIKTGNQTNSGVGFQDNFDVEKVGEEVDQTYVLFLVWSAGSKNPQNNDKDAAFDGKEHDFDAKKPESVVILSSSSSAQTKKQDGKTKIEDKGKSLVEYFIGYRDLNAEFEDCSANSSNEVNVAGSIVPTVGQNSLNSTNTFSAAGPYNTAVSLIYGKSSFIDASQLLNDPDMPELKDITYFDDEDVGGAEADFNNLESFIPVSHILTTIIHKDHPVSQIIGDLSSTTQTRSMTRAVKDQGGLSQMFDNDFHTCMFACFLSQEEPKRVHQAFKYPSWIKAMQEELLQFKMQKFWVLVDLPYGKRAIGTKWEEGINYEEVFAPVAKIKAIRLFLAYASFMGFMVYQMDVKSAFLYGTIEEEVYVCQPIGFEDPNHPDKVYKVVKALYGLHQALKLDDIIFGATNKDLCKLFEKLMKDKFQMSSMGELTFFLGLQVKQKKDGIFINQDKYVAEILSKFGLTKGKLASTPIDTEKPLLKDPDGEDVDVHTYRSMIGSLMYLTSSRPDIMFAVCACAHFQVTPKGSHLHAVKRIFRYLKGKPHLGLWYPKDSPFDLVAYSDSDYTGASLDRKSTTGGFQKQTALGKDKSNLLMADNLPKIIWYSTHHITLMKSWLVQKQMALGKDKSNPLMADNLPKIVWYSTHHITLVKSWLVQKQKALGQTTTGKELSNPFMAGSLPKTILTTFLHIIYIKYALTINPHIYVSCIKQLWNTVVVKQTNDVTRLQALVDKKKVVIMEATIRDALCVDDAKGVDCLPNEEIFAELARMGYEKPSIKLTFYKAFFSSQWKFLIHTILQSMSAKRTSWNEFSSAMASAVICLSTGRKVNFSKYIFESLVRNVDNCSKFYMYPQFIQLIIRNQLGDLSTHTTKYTSPALTQKVFASIRRVGKGFSGVETPLFEGMLVTEVIEKEGNAEEQV